jgi:opacity protein-like surface antigen
MFIRRVKVRAVQRVDPEGVVAATDTLRWLVTAALILGGFESHAAILPEDRADVMYHGYDGGGLEVTGPSVLVRKGFKDKVSVWGNYYVDMISSASIDVVATASPYEEERTEYSIGADYLHGKTTMGLSFTNSEESDYSANAMRFGISRDFFGDLTTFGISYARGWDEVRRNGDDVFVEETDRQSYRVDVSQIITRSLIVSLNYEGITDEGFLNNPYRQVRYADPTVPVLGYSYEAERYPRTKTSTATAVRAMYYLPYRAALKGEYRNYSDSWGISAYNVEVGYTHPFTDRLIVDLKYRFYDQTAADFYSDLFPFQNAQNFLARDKELASFSSHTIGLGISYEFAPGWIPFFAKSGVHFNVDYIQFDYGDFRNVQEVAPDQPGTEPLYAFDSVVLRLFLSFRY